MMLASRQIWLRRLFRLHGWLGLLTGLPLLVLGLSGSALVFRKELDMWLAPAAHVAVPKPANRLTLDSLYRIAARRYPALEGIGVTRFPSAPDESYEFRLYANDGRPGSYDLYSLNLDPYTGRVLREGSYEGLAGGFFNWLLQFHFCFNLGLTGIALVAVFGLTLLLSVLTGAVVYRKHLGRALTFRIPLRRRNWRLFSSDLHRLAGVWSLIFNAIIFFTGFWMNRFGFDPAVWQENRQAIAPNTPVAQSIDRLWRLAQAAKPDLVPHFAYLPTQPGKDFSLSGTIRGHEVPWGEYAATVTVHPHTGQVKTVFDVRHTATFAEAFDTLAGPLHYGTAGGTPMRIFYVLVGLTPGLLALTGFALWWRRTRSRWADQARR